MGKHEIIFQTLWGLNTNKSLDEAEDDCFGKLGGSDETLNKQTDKPGKCLQNSSS